jgi:protein-tyrosine-phosphatase
VVARNQKEHAMTQPEPNPNWTIDNPVQLSEVTRPTAAPSTAPFQVAFVCSANRFRSALAEGVCAHLLAGTGVQVTSYGMLDLPEGAPSKTAVKVAGKLKVDLSGHRSRHLKPGVLSGANVVIGFDRSHLSAAVVEGGAQPDRTFLLTELVQLLLAAGAGTTLGQVSPDEMVQRLHPARQLIGNGPVFKPIADPAKQSPAVQKAVAIKVAELVVGATDAIFSSEGVDGPTREMLVRLERLKKGGAPGQALRLFRPRGPRVPAHTHDGRRHRRRPA